MRKTPLTDARKSQPVDTLPSSLIGSSSRQIRRAINVPLATAQAGESARQRRDKERLGGDERVSVMISPYGRRRAVESEQRERSVATGEWSQLRSVRERADDSRPHYQEPIPQQKSSYRPLDGFCSYSNSRTTPITIPRADASSVFALEKGRWGGNTPSKEIDKRKRISQECRCRDLCTEGEWTKKA